MNNITLDSLCKNNSDLTIPSLSDLYNSLNHSHGIKQDEINVQEATIITQAFDSPLHLIEQFMRYIENSKTLPFILKPRLSVNDQKLALQLEQVSHWLCEYKPFFCYSPHVSLFFAIALSFPVTFPRKIDPREVILGKSITEWGNQFVEQLRQALHSSKFKDRVRHKEENARRSFSSSIRYVQHLFDRYSRLLVIRIDFALRRDQNEFEEPLDRILNYFSQLKMQMKRRSRVRRALVGYIAHLEYSLVKGHHLHAIFFFNGNKVINDYSISFRIASLWSRITENKGIYFNTHVKTLQYSCPATGMIHRSDEKKRCCLAYVIWYITKLDQQLIYKYQDKQRVFFRGEIKGK